MDGSLSWTVSAEPLPAWCTGTQADRQQLKAEVERLAADGYNAAEIGERLKIGLVRVQPIGRREGITLAGRGGMRHLTMEIPARHMQVVDILAQEAGVSRAVMLTRLAITSLDGAAAGARRLLGKDAKPKRRYVMTKPRQRKSSLIGPSGTALKTTSVGRCG